MAREIRDFSDDDSTHTLSIINDVTHQNCNVEQREYTFLNDDDELCQGCDITLETVSEENDAVYRSLEDLRISAEQEDITNE